MSRPIAILVAAGFALLVGACSSVYYDAWEQVGVEKRHILADRVEDGREDQQEAQEQFQTTFDAFQALTGFEGGDLEDAYRELTDEYEECEERAETVRDRIASIEKVATDLFSEWESEIGLISDPTMRSRSQGNLRDTRASYGRLIAAMETAASRMDPVLGAFRDRVLYLKHNLNSAAIASLEGDVVEIQGDVGKLIADMNAAIAEADEFLGKLEG